MPAAPPSLGSRGRASAPAARLRRAVPSGTAGGGGPLVSLRRSDRLAAGAQEAAPLMNIGEAAAAGVSAKMIRHYEAIGLVRPRRAANGYRTYAASDVAVLRFIRHARDFGFPLGEVRRLLALWRDRRRSSAEVKRLALDHVAALEAKAASLRAMAASLRHLAEHCHGDERPDCPILDELGGMEGVETA